MPTVLITGANRGLGLELARQYSAEGWRVFACSRSIEVPALQSPSPERGRVTTHALDVTNHAAVQRLAGELSAIDSFEAA